MTPEQKKDLIYQAIADRKIIEFQYHDKPRTVEPYCCGINRKDSHQLRGFQVSGGSASDEKLGWRMFDLAEMSGLRTTDKDFSGWAGDRRLYNPNDTAFRTIFCRVPR
jgi:predicted DNA-binding transcriptional regulator YafY